MEWLWALIVGGIVGWLASILMKADMQMGLIANILVGIVGSALGFWLAGMLGLAGGGLVVRLIVGVAGAALLIFLLWSVGTYGLARGLSAAALLWGLPVGLAALLAHEGMPGHHLETGIKLENKVPEFRRRTFFNAYGEGWGLYAESLGHELGLYGDPLELMGRYSFELFRACRLVIDTGLHAKGWTREQSIRYFVEECGQSEGGATNEVLRYMVWPGQALGYKIGELTILDLRAKAEKRLGKRFDLRAFHDAILEEGPLPLTMLRQRMDAWIDAEDRKRSL